MSSNWDFMLKENFTNNQKNFTFYRIYKTKVSMNGQWFTVRWKTGYELFDTFAIENGPIKILTNYITGNKIKFSNLDEGLISFEPYVRVPVVSGLALWNVQNLDKSSNNLNRTYLILLCF